MVFKLAMKSLVMPLFGAPPVNAAYHHLAGNPGAALLMVLAAIFVAGFGEEALFRGFAFQRLHGVLGRGPAATLIIVLFTTLWFALGHYQNQGIPGVEQALVTGLVFGATYAFKRNLWPIMVAHATFDLVAIAIIYYDVETVVAHWVFR